MGQPIDQALCNPKIQTSFFLSNFHIQCFILKEDKDILPRICFSSSEKKFSAITPPQQVQKYLILLVIYASTLHPNLRNVALYNPTLWNGCAHFESLSLLSHFPPMHHKP